MNLRQTIIECDYQYAVQQNLFVRHHYTLMNTTRFLPAMCFLLLVGCKSDHLISSVTIPDQSQLAVSASPVSTTNYYYMIDKGPGCAIFLPYVFGSSSEGRIVAVVDGHFPPPSQMPISPTISASQLFPSYDYGRRDMSLIDDTGTK